MVKYLVLGLVVVALGLAGCSPAPAEVMDAEPEPTLVKVTDADALTGLWLRPGSQHSSYTRFEPDGTFRMAFERENLLEAPDVRGNYWFENEQFHVEDNDYSELLQGDPGSFCLDIVGVYEVTKENEDKLVFTLVQDACEGRSENLSTSLGLTRLE